jgi:hypothetical protein
MTILPGYPTKSERLSMGLPHRLYPTSHPPTPHLCLTCNLFVVAAFVGFVQLVTINRTTSSHTELDEGLRANLLAVLLTFTWLQ